MNISRVALIFDTIQRPETAGVYCRRALEKLVAVEHFQLHEMDRVPRQGFDLYLNIDDGLRYRLPAELRPCAFWAIDTHLTFDRCREKAPGFDVVFAAQRDGVELLRGIGVSSASWLPLACDPEIHRKHERCQAVRRCVRRQCFSGAARRTAGADPAAIPQLVRWSVLLRRDGADVFGGPHRIQSQHSQRRQHARLRGGRLRIDAADQRPGRQRPGRAVSGRRAPGDVSRAGRPAR